MRVVVPLLKLGLAGGAVYYVADQGLFSISQKETIDASKRISNSVPEVPGLENYTNKLSVGISKNDLINYWNTGVKVSIAALASLPADTKELASRGYHYMKEELGKQMK
ncbi:MICOS complex subunit MIC13-like [Argiope bruennichi]|uniref:MICOS complex subunit MIC13 n=1 Tax=Argiope bruennichi TaxID=94029 RepID=A0A8T0FAH2_ARGBR|nr:MICOS complex subunit MIC13-like [Argiope bruennichi]KAF8788257.1 MICOS complex subunit MIC13 like protein [Argiope bruennichi]